MYCRWNNYRWTTIRIFISYFNLQLRNGSIIRVFGYDEKADFIYRKIEKGQSILVEGRIRIRNKNIEVEMEKVDKINK